MPAKEKKCVGGGHDGQPIHSAIDEKECIREEGRPVEVGDGGRDRITTDLVENYLAAPEFSAPVAGQALTNTDTVERLVLYPICALRDDSPSAQLLAGLEAFNRDHAAEVRRMAAKDDRLLRSMFQLMLDVSSVAASILDSSRTGRATTFRISDEVLDRAEAVAGSIRSQTSDEALSADVERLVTLASTLRGVRVSDAAEVLRGGGATAT
jgi:hypothetical protein